MKSTSVDNIKIQTKEKLIYFHPVYTTILFLIVLPYSCAVIYLLHNSWTNNQLKLFALITFTIVILTPAFLMVFQAFLRLILNKPAIRLTKFRLYDHLNHVDFRWGDVKKTAQSNINSWAYISTENLDVPIIFKEIKNPIKYVYLLCVRFIKRRKIRKINLILLKGKNVDILSDIIRYSECK